MINPKKPDNKNQPKEKTATDNLWFSTGLNNFPDSRERRDGPGGENAKDKK